MDQCKHCNNISEYDNANYCTHCGAPLRTMTINVTKDPEIMPIFIPEDPKELESAESLEQFAEHCAIYNKTAPAEFYPFVCATCYNYVTNDNKVHCPSCIGKNWKIRKPA
jgi:rRNA maturation endonuclease Nob1